MDAPAQSKRKVAFLAHCLLNQNAKVDEKAWYPGVVKPAIDLLREFGYELAQLPCPEMTFLGVNRWWQTKDQYDTAGYRRHCRFLARPVADLIESYLKQGYQVIIIGLDGSPSSGVRQTGRNAPGGRIWGGRPEGSVEDVVGVPGKGVWMEELEKELNERGLVFPPATGLPMDLPGFNMEASLAELRQFLQELEERGAYAGR